MQWRRRRLGCLGGGHAVGQRWPRFVNAHVLVGDIFDVGQKDGVDLRIDHLVDDALDASFEKSGSAVWGND